MQRALDQFKMAVRDSGIAPDQLANFLRAGYVPQRRQLDFHVACRSCDKPDGPEMIGFGGARGPGKTTASFAQVALDDCQRMPGLKVLFLRKVSKAARESVEDLRRKLLRQTKHNWKSQQGIIEFPNDSRLYIGHFAHDKDIDSYLGLEYDLIAIEEDTQLSPGKKNDIFTCLRTSNAKWRPRSYRTTNPGGVDHLGFKKEFIEHWRKKTETTTRFIPATVYDNKAVDPGYRKKLERLSGWKRDAWLDGDWDVMGGQYFSTWNYDVHTYDPETVSIGNHWPFWMGMDYGFIHPTYAALCTEFDGDIYIVDEHCESKWLPKSHAEAIHEMVGRYGRTIDDLDCIVGGEDFFQQRGDENAKTISEQYQSHGISLTLAPMARISGWGEMLNYLGDVQRGIRPRLRISRKCVRLIECLPALQHNPNKVEDVLKWDMGEDGDGGDDPADGARYALMARLVGAPDVPAVGGKRNQFRA